MIRTVPRLQPREKLPHVADEPKAAWCNGWWSGLCVGAINGAAIAVVILRIARCV